MYSLYKKIFFFVVIHTFILILPGQMLCTNYTMYPSNFLPPLSRKGMPDRKKVNKKTDS